MLTILWRESYYLSPHLFQPLMRASDIAGILVFVGMAASSVVLVAILPIETNGRALKVSVLESSVGLICKYCSLIAGCK